MSSPHEAKRNAGARAGEVGPGFRFAPSGLRLLRMPQAYDLWYAERALKKEIAKIPTAKARAA